MRFLVLAVLLVALPAGAVTLDWVTVGDPGNAANTASNCLNSAADCGSVADAYRISKYEVTNDQYAEFLNAVAATDTFGLYSTGMASDATGGIDRSGSPGSFSYAVKSGMGNNPVIYVSWYDALRFANWLGNGQPAGAQEAGTTETGAYTFTGATEVGGRDVGARTFLPTENEWYKAAYYDPVSAGFFEYPTGSDIAPSSEAPPGGSNSANFFGPAGYMLTGSMTFESALNYQTDVGAYASSESPYGTLDQGGNVWEWNETAIGSFRGQRGGSWGTPAGTLAASGPSSDDPAAEGHGTGFRVAPEPAQMLLVLTGGLVLAAVRKRRT